MRFQQLVIGFVLATAGAFTAVVSTAASDDQDTSKQVQAEKDKKPAEEPKGNLDRLQVVKLNEILENQQRLLNRLDTLEGTTLPNQLHGVQSSILDGIVATQAELIQVIGGLEEQCTSADLLPLPAPGSTGPYGYCQFNADFTKLLVRVHNQGGAASGPSTTRVTFFGGSPAVDQATPGLAPFGGFVDLLYDIPESCYPVTGGDTQCNFSIAADVANAVGESNEANNVAAGICVRIG